VTCGAPAVETPYGTGLEDGCGVVVATGVGEAVIPPADGGAECEEAIAPAGASVAAAAQAATTYAVLRLRRNAGCRPLGIKLLDLTHFAPAYGVS
jgi:hypothetical protein